MTEFRQRFGVVGAGLVADARRAAGAAASGAGPGKEITAAWTSGLYGEPGHIDPLTGRPSWIMYLGLGTGRSLGAPATTMAALMSRLLGPDSQIGYWKVRHGARGGSVPLVACAHRSVGTGTG